MVIRSISSLALFLVEDTYVNRLFTSCVKGYSEIDTTVNKAFICF